MQNQFFKKIKYFFEEVILYPFLLGVFFVLFHLKDAFILYPGLYILLFICLCTLLSGFLFLVLYFFFKNKIKAGIIGILTMMVFLFFDNIRYTLYQLTHLPYIYLKFIVAALLILVLLPVLFTKSKLRQLNAYLNVLFIVLIVFELGAIGKTYFQSRSYIRYIQQKTIPTQSQTDKKENKNYPNIYHIVMDAYTSSEELKKNWNYDNAELDSFLIHKGFYSAWHAQSNSTATQMSMAMNFNMDYIPNFDSIIRNDVVSTSAYRLAIKNNQVVAQLIEKGYQIINLSIFDVADTKRFHNEVFMPDATSLPKFLFRDCLLKWPSNKKVPKFNGQTNLDIFSELEKVPAKQNKAPFFVYAHIMMPHGPDYFDRNGKMYPDGKGPFKKETKKNYLESLIYANTLLMHSIEKIMTDSKTPPVIIIQGDHGSRLLREEGNYTEEYSMLARFYFPDKDYLMLYDSISPVNIYRVIFNKYFGSNYPMLQDRKIHSAMDSH